MGEKEISAFLRQTALSLDPTTPRNFTNHNSMRLYLCNDPKLVGNLRDSLLILKTSSDVFQP